MLNTIDEKVDQNKLFLVTADLKSLSSDQIFLPAGIVLPEGFAGWREARKTTWLTGRAVLSALVEKFGGSKPSGVFPAISRHGKPYIHGNPFFFNISHSRDKFILLAAPYEVGADIESVALRKNQAGLMSRCMNKFEQQWILGRSFNEAEKPEFNQECFTEDAEVLQRFFILWTVHEALVKTSGAGLQGLREFTVDPYINTICHQTMTGQICSYIYGSMALSLYFRNAAGSNCLQTLSWDPLNGLGKTKSWQQKPILCMNIRQGNSI